VQDVPDICFEMSHVLHPLLSAAPGYAWAMMRQVDLDGPSVG
jgi:hypothetical protein